MIENETNTKIVDLIEADKCRRMIAKLYYGVA